MASENQKEKTEQSIAYSGGNQTISHFWVSGSDFFSSSLYISPAPTCDVDSVSQLEFYDCDGECVNQVAVQFAPGEIGLVELDQFLAGFKMQAGYCHGQLFVKSAAGFGHMMRIHGNDAASLISRSLRINQSTGGFFPVSFADDRTFLVAVMSQDLEPTRVTVRLISGKRSPETVFELPPKGTRVVSLGTEFPQIASAGSGREVQAYVRVRTKSEKGVSVQVIEQSGESGVGAIYSMVG